MNNGTNGSSGRPQGDHVREVVRSAEEELRQLLRQRAELMKRIGTIKQTLAGLANIFGRSVLSEELLTLVDGRTAARQSGFTRACRLVLMDSETPLSARQVCERLQERFPTILERHRSPVASVTTVLSRLVDYSEANSVLDASGRRVWLWIASDEREETLVKDERAVEAVAQTTAPV
jgi:chorismate mutase